MSKFINLLLLGRDITAAKNVAAIINEIERMDGEPADWDEEDVIGIAIENGLSAMLERRSRQLALRKKVAAVPSVTAATSAKLVGAMQAE